VKVSELRELYQALIIDHGRNPRNFGELPAANHTAEGFNPLCGDQLTLYLEIDSTTETVKSIRFKGSGCAISMASASLMAEQLQGKTITEIKEVFRVFHQYVTTEVEMDEASADKLGKLAVLSGVRAFPTRVKCATLAWHTLQMALNQSGTTTTTE
jgi:nitrogen fixation NifU-like protein